MPEDVENPSFYGKHSLIQSDQGVRGFLSLLNDIFYMSSLNWELRRWRASASAGAGDEIAVSDALASLEFTDIPKRLELFSKELSTFDWRSSGAPNLTKDERRAKLAFKGSGGYKELRSQLHEHLSNSEHADLAQVSSDVLAVLD